MAAYPENFPLAEAMLVVEVVRKDHVQDRLPEFANAVWTLQGYAMRFALGDPIAQTQALPDEHVDLFAVRPDGFDAVAELEKVIALNRWEDDGGAAAQISFPWQLLLKWALEELVMLVATARP